MKIYYTSDVHGFFFPTDYLDKEYKNTGLFCQMADFSYDKNTLRIDGGDTLEGCAFVDMIHEKNDAKIIADIMNEAGYDFYTLGNHDFNFGYDYLKSYVDSMNAKCLTANVIDKTGNLEIYPYVKFKMEDKKIGIIGLVTDWINLWERKENLENFEIKNSYETLKKYYKEIQDCDLKILIYHGGLEIDPKTKKILKDTDENIGGKIAKEFDFDIILAGHTHTRFNENLYGTVFVENKANAVEYSLVDIGDEIAVKHIESIKKPDYRINKYQDYNDVLQNILDIPIAKLDHDLLPDTKINMAINGSKLADFINKILINYTNSDISITSFANEIEGFRKEITQRDVLLTYKFPNVPVTCEIDSKTLKDALEQNYTYIHYDEEKGFFINEKFLSPTIEHFNFDFFYGIEFDVDFKADDYNKISNIKFKGEKIKKNQKFKITMNNYRKTGAGNFTMYSNLKVIKEYQKEIKNIIIDYLKEKK
ncbi:MAG: 5'-nucleotidase C-terminal domain-containing protein [Peptoniphilaceae bacterium]|nr:5'-nucleotidase C-terminal domain-containing protein [Peptoniphilaceae bacterium]MDD7383491.1 5'-nucleotidase C-terminal domain-containing protein [Peptoniphilaceae bacterium]MDY3738664.1 5'-nucleotidase C-terminal domain-containing protein [Peptoniphilaceae bacterium]